MSNYPGLGDGFNRLSGVAPGCNWADAKIGRSDNGGSSSWVNAAIDDLVSQRVALNLKVLSLSWSVTGDLGIDLSQRQKVNSAVNSGIVFTKSAGNDGAMATDAQREIKDPSRAAFALTVGASLDGNQLAGYTSQGFTPSYTTGPYAEDYKPDLMAPGGGRAYSSMLAPDNNFNDGLFADQQRDDYQSGEGTSFAAPFAAGAAALVIDAMQKQGIQWDFGSARHALFVKMLLCATASESNLPRQGGKNNPTIERATGGPGGYPPGKDPYEGYGMINPDAAVEAVCLSSTNGTSNSESLGGTSADRRVWARNLTLTGGRIFVANLTVPSTGDFDLYVYRAEPGLYGNPIILASSTRTNSGMNESLNYLASSNTPAFLVVKRVSGSGQFTLVPDAAPPPRLVSPTLNANDLTLPFQTLAGRTYYIEYKDSLNDTAWQQFPPVFGNGSLKVLTDPVIPDGQRFYRLRVE